MRRISLTQTGAGSTQVVPMDQYISPFNVGFDVVDAGGATYSVQYTFDDVFANDFDPATATWFTHPDAAGLTDNFDGNIAFPVSAMRLTVSAGTTPVTINILQAGIGGA